MVIGFLICFTVTQMLWFSNPVSVSKPIKDMVLHPQEYIHSLHIQDMLGLTRKGAREMAGG